VVAAGVAALLHPPVAAVADAVRPLHRTAAARQAGGKI
jgi:hypothetical protein